MNALAIPFSPAQRPLRRRAFTLIEILIVIAVIVILAGIVVAISRGVTSGAKQRATEATMTKLDMAMSSFMATNPEPAPGPTAYVLALKTMPSSAGIISNSSTNGTTIKDGWGNDIVYVPAKSPPRNLPTGYFQSYGPDGQANTNDDVFSKGAAAQP